MNLKNLYGHRYRVALEFEGADPSDDRYWVIQCEHGHLYVHGHDMLGAATDHAGRVAKRLAALPCVTMWQDGDDGINVIFLPADFNEVAAVMKPLSRRKLSEAHKAKLLAAGAKH